MANAIPTLTNGTIVKNPSFMLTVKKSDCVQFFLCAKTCSLDFINSFAYHKIELVGSVFILTSFLNK